MERDSSPMTIKRSTLCWHLSPNTNPQKRSLSCSAHPIWVIVANFCCFIDLLFALYQYRKEFFTESKCVSVKLHLWFAARWFCGIAMMKTQIAQIGYNLLDSQWNAQLLPSLWAPHHKSVSPHQTQYVCTFALRAGVFDYLFLVFSKY